jgi:hypothetical protein
MTWTFPHAVKGWLTESEGHALAQLASNRTVLEVGSYHGRSTICMAQTAVMVHAVDWCIGDESASFGWGLPALGDNLKPYIISGKVILYVGRFSTVAEMLPSEAFDLVFIDGAHDYDSVCSDLRQAQRLIKPDGIWALHDWNREAVRNAAFDVLRWGDDHPGVKVDLLFITRSTNDGQLARIAGANGGAAGEHRKDSARELQRHAEPV